MSVLVDYHHPQLHRSLELLFNRLGATLYTPYGREWLDEGYYNYYGDEKKSLNFLNCGNLSLEDASEIEFSFVLTTIPLSEGYFTRFINERNPLAKQVVVLGNVGYVPPQLPLLTTTSYQPPGSCFFHQEFDYSDFTPIKNFNKITSFLSNPSMYQDFPIWRENMNLFPDWDWLEYGFDTKHGYLSMPEVAKAMEDTTWVWHAKHIGEGYGHVVHQAAAIGRPLLVRKHYFAGSLIEKYLIHGVTCLDLDQCATPQSFITQLNQLTSKADKMGRALRALWEASVDYELETQRVRTFLGGL